MNAGGHGSDLAASLEAVSVVDLRTGGVQRLGAADAGARLPDAPPLRPEQLVVEAQLRLEPGDPDAGGRAHRRDRGLAAGEPAGRSQRRLGVRQPAGGLGRPAHRGRRGQGAALGTAQVSDRHANFIQADDGGRADDVHRADAGGAVHGPRATAAPTCDPETVLVGFPPWPRARSTRSDARR